MVAVAKACHQLGYGIGLKRGWHRHLGTQFNPPKKNSKAMIQPTGLLSHSRVSSLLEIQDSSKENSNDYTSIFRHRLRFDRTRQQ